ncbi:hypothetical protein Tco_1531110 [Tanacetum coccineum]
MLSIPSILEIHREIWNLPGGSLEVRDTSDIPEVGGCSTCEQEGGALVLCYLGEEWSRSKKLGSSCLRAMLGTTIIYSQHSGTLIVGGDIVEFEIVLPLFQGIKDLRPRNPSGGVLGAIEP